ncbi:uncharacterized protein [Blastocystis hominis]|uniref:C2 domain-containing protein n=1 Tax=Blastocystis hominis TaxID=12968 RepID=D8LXD1_BLAHO|nr:uncharacterized protein [Blastocystis hominis]CBK20926.2 unnamed protein product [Blastocystis hominis]|eukprot:XP_012894974.1 uncharacterized protein [Blastocystis hominis]
MKSFNYQIRLVLIGAQQLRDISTRGKLDAFARIYYQDTDYRTSTLHDCGKNPTWNCSLSFSGSSSKIRIEVYDERLLGEKYIGECLIDCELIPQGFHRFVIPLTMRGVPNSSLGTVRVNITVHCLHNSGDWRTCGYEEELSSIISTPKYASCPVLNITSIPVFRVEDPLPPDLPVLATNSCGECPVLKCGVPLSQHPELLSGGSMHRSPSFGAMSGKHLNSPRGNGRMQQARPVYPPRKASGRQMAHARAKRASSSPNTK